jgi:hypothetical protein
MPKVSVLNTYNLYAIRILSPPAKAAIIALFRAVNRYVGNKHGHFPTRERPMPSLDPDVADLATSDPVLSSYNEQHAITYMRINSAVDLEHDGRVSLHKHENALARDRNGA